MGDDAPSAPPAPPPPPPLLLELVTLTVAIGACGLIALLAGVVTAQELGPPLGTTFPQYPLDRFLSGGRRATVNGLALAVLLRRARSVGRVRLALEASALAVGLKLLGVPLAFLPACLPSGLGREVDALWRNTTPELVLGHLVASFRTQHEWILMGARAWGLYLAARARGRPWQGLVWEGPMAVVCTRAYGALNVPAVYIEWLFILGVTAVALPCCVRRVDAWLAWHQEWEGPQ